MRAECFLDTHVLVHAAAGRGRAEETKRKHALKLIDTHDFGLSAQVLQEFYVTVTRKIAAPKSAEEALEWIVQFEAFPCVAVDAALVKIAVEISERFQLSYWDGSIVAAAEALGAGTLYTEDLNPGQKYGSLVVENPFQTM